MILAYSISFLLKYFIRKDDTLMRVKTKDTASIYFYAINIVYYWANY